MQEVRRADDDELCGFVDERDDGWHGLTLFGATLAVFDDRDDAERHIRTVGLASLAERWLLLDRADASGGTEAPGDAQVVCIQEASPEHVVVALGYSSMPGVPVRHVTRGELDSGDVVLRPRS